MAAKRVLTSFDLAQNELQFAVTHNLAAAPAAPKVGQRYYNTATSTEYYWNGAWIPVDARLRTGIPLANLATDPLARANHTGVQTASTISDFATATRAVTAFPIGNLTVDPLARANHTGTQLAATISDLTAAVQAVTAFPIGNLTVDPLARANHTGTQLAATISDLATAVQGVTNIPLSALATDPLARANHTGTQVAATISDFTAATRAVTAFPITNLTTDPLARANHTGTQAAATISDLAAVVKAYKLNEFAAPVAAVSMGGQLLSNVGTAVAGTDAVNKNMLDASIQGMSVKPSADVATVVALPTSVYANGNSGVGATLTASANGALVVDGYTVPANDTVLVNNQAAPAQNGLYVVTAAGAAGAPWVLTRHSTMDLAAEFNGAFVAIESSGQTVTANRLYLCSSNVVTVGTTAVSFTQVNSPTVITGQNGVSISSNVASAVVAASGGLSVSASGLSLDLTIAIRKYVASVGNGSATSIAVTHNLNTLDVTVGVYEVAGGAEVEVDVVRTSVNVVTVNFGTAPTSNQYRVVVHG